MLFLNMSNLDSGTLSVFSAFQNEMVNFSVKIQGSLDLTFLIWSMLLFFITFDNYDYNRYKLLKVRHEKIQNVTVNILI